MGRFLLRGGADARTPTRHGNTSRKSKASAAWRKPSKRVFRRCASRRRPRKQAHIDSGSEIIVGVNKYRLPKEDPIDILAVDNTAVREAQIKRLHDLRANRNEADVQRALAAITECVRSGKGNLLELAVEAAKVRATLGEISDACEVVVGRYKAVIRSISGVYSSEVKTDENFAKAKAMAEELARREGAPAAHHDCQLGQDGHDRGAKVVATGYADIGFDGTWARSSRHRPKRLNRPSKTTCTWWAYRRSPQGTHPRPADNRRTQKAGPRGHRGHRGRRHPCAGLRGTLCRRRRRHLRPRHADSHGSYQDTRNSHAGVIPSARHAIQ